MSRALAILLLAVAPVAAQPAPKTAEDHYEQSRRYYDVDEYDKAIAELKIAYTLSPDPVYLFNIAQAMRKKGDCAGAIEYYRKYLRGSSNAPNKTNVEDSIKELEANPASCKKVETSDPKPIDPNPTPPKPIDPKPKTTGMVETRPPITGPEPAPGPSDKRMLRIAGLATGGAGVLLVAGGALLALSARSIANDVARECNGMTGCDWGEQGPIDDRGRSRATLSRIAFGVGTGAIAGGVVMYMLARSSKESPIALAPTTSGALVVTGGRF